MVVKLSQVGQFGPKWDKSGTFSDHISVYFRLSEPGFVPFGFNLTYFGPKSDTPELEIDQ